MKKWTALSLALALLLCLSGCGGEKGVTLLNNLGVDLTLVDVMNRNGSGTSLPAGIASGESDTVFIRCEDKVGYVEIRVIDTAGNLYLFPDVYLHDAVTLSLDNTDGVFFARHEYKGDLYEHEGACIPLEKLNLMVIGQWLHPDGEYSIRFDGIEYFHWVSPSGIETGTYRFDGKTVHLTLVDGSASLTLDEEGRLVPDGNLNEVYIQQ